MKYLLSVFLFLSASVSAQQLDILLIGASHNYSTYAPQDFSGIHRKIKQFQPTAFFGEFLSKEDEQNLMDYWCKQDNLKRLKILRSNRDINAAALPATIARLRELSVRNPQDYRLKVDLAHAYYLNQDVSNGHYQYWLVLNHLQQKPDQELEHYLSTVLSPQSDVTGRSMKRLRTSEYATIAFPMMHEMGIRELVPMDCQDFDLNWSAAAVAFYNKFEAMKKDTNASFASALKTMLDRRDAGFRKYAGMEKKSAHVTEWLNTDEASAISASGDFFFKEMYDLEAFPKAEMQAQLHWWMKRNSGMCENVVKRARSLKAQKVVVIVGANHRKFMQDLLEATPGVRVKNIYEIK
jgi:hypothetical protein